MPISGKANAFGIKKSIPVGDSTPSAPPEPETVNHDYYDANSRQVESTKASVSNVFNLFNTSDHDTFTIVNPNVEQHTLDESELFDIKRQLTKSLTDVNQLASQFSYSDQEYKPIHLHKILQKLDDIAPRKDELRTRNEYWRLRLLKRLQNHYQERLSFQQNIHESSINNEPRIEGINREIAKIQERLSIVSENDNLLNKIHIVSHFYHSVQWQLSPLIPPVVAELAQTSGEQHTHLQHLQTEVTRARDEICHLSDQYQIARHQQARYHFFAALPEKLDRFQRQLDEQRSCLRNHLAQLHIQQKMLFHGRARAEIVNVFDQFSSLISIEEFLLLQKQISKQTHIADQAIRQLQENQLQIQAQYQWLAQLHCMMPTQADLAQTGKRCEQIHVLMAEQQKKLQQFDHYTTLVCSGHAQEKPLTDLQLHQLRQQIYALKQEITSLKSHLGDLSTEEVILLQKMNASEKPLAGIADIQAQQQRLHAVFVNLDRQSDELSSCESRLAQYHTDKQIENIAGFWALRKINRTLLTHQQTLRTLTTGQLSVRNIERWIQQINAIPVLTKINPSNQRATEWNIEKLDKLQHQVADHKNTLSEMISTLNAFQSALGGNLNLEQFTAAPLLIPTRHAKALLSSREKLLEQTQRATHLDRQLSAVQDTINTKREKLQPKPHAIIAAFSTTLTQEAPSHHSITANLIAPSLLSTKTQYVFSHAHLPIAMDTRKLRFKPQSDFKANQRKSVANENINHYTLHNEIDTIREMVDQAIANGWKPLRFHGGQRAGKQQHRYDYLVTACARAEVRGIEVDWVNLKGAGAIRGSQALKKAIAAEEKLLAKDLAQSQRNLDILAPAG